MAGLNNSIFNLPSSQDEIRVPEQAIKISTRKIIPKSASKLESFPGSDITFDFTLSGNQHWLPSRSFVVIRDSIYIGRNVQANNNPDQPILADDLAPALNLQDNLWDGCQLTIGGFSLGSRTKLAPQISAVNKRVMKSASWLSGVGKSAHTWDADFGVRQQQIIRAGMVSGSRSIKTGPGTITVVAATSALVGQNALFLQNLQPGSLILTDGNDNGGVRQMLQIKTVTDDDNATFTSSENVAEGDATTYAIVGEPTSRSNKNERIYVPPLGIFNQSKALKMW